MWHIGTLHINTICYLFRRFMWYNVECFFTGHAYISTRWSTTNLHSASVSNRSVIVLLAITSRNMFFPFVRKLAVCGACRTNFFRTVSNPQPSNSRSVSSTGNPSTTGADPALSPGLYSSGRSFQQMENILALKKFGTRFKKSEREVQQCLDIGSGSGEFTQELLRNVIGPRHRIVGVDISQDMVDYATRHCDDPNISFDSPRHRTAWRLRFRRGAWSIRQRLLILLPTMGRGPSYGFP